MIVETNIFNKIKNRVASTVSNNSF